MPTDQLPRLPPTADGGEAMTDRGLVALTLVVVVTMAVFSGGMSQSLLHDSEVVTATIDVGTADPAINTGPPERGPQNVSQPDDRERACENAASETIDEENQSDGIAIRFDPGNRTVDAGNETEYRVLVEGASDNITSYYLGFTLCDPSVATLEGFDHWHVTDSSQDNESVTDDLLEVSNGYGSDYPTTSDGDIILGTITVAGNASGEVEIGVADVKNDIRDDGAERYNITATDEASLTVTAPETGSGEGDDSRDNENES